MPARVTTRPFSEEERARLSRPWPRQHGWRSGLLAAGLLFVVAVLCALLASPLLPPPAILPVAVSVGLLAMVARYAWVQRDERRRARKWAGETARDLAEGHVESTTYEITEAVAVEEAEDEGPSYYLLLDDGRTLFLTGQYLWEPVQQGFPWRTFEIDRLPVGRHVLRVVSHGPALRPSLTRPPLSESEVAAMPADGSIERRDFADLKLRRPWW